MKKTVIFTLIALCCTFFACTKHDIDLFTTNIALHVGETKRISAISDKNLFFFSENDSIAIVNESGLLKAIGLGYTNIKVSNEWLSKKVLVHVIPDDSCITPQK